MRKLLLVMVSISLMLVFSSLFTEARINASFRFLDNFSPAIIRYDRAGFSANSSEVNYSYGSNSYMDHSPTTPNLFLSICHPNLTNDRYVDIAYYTETRNITAGILSRPLLLWDSAYDNYGSYCTRIDTDMSSRKALYPGYVAPIIYLTQEAAAGGGNITDKNILSPLSTLLNGSYHIGVRVDAPPKTYYLSVQDIYDDQGLPITVSEEYLLMSFIDSFGVSVVEDKVRPGDTIEYNGEMLGGEIVYVNGLSSLEIIMFDPCGQINNSGYYMLNRSEFNLNRSCIVINSTNNVVLNFAGEILDGDNEPSGSLQNDSCTIIVVNSRNVSIEYLHAQQFYYGICVKNSTLDLISLQSVGNKHGALVEKGSSVRIIDLEFGSNTETDILSRGNSTLRLVNVTFASAIIHSRFKDAAVRSVLNPPEPPDYENIRDIGQFIEFNAMSPDSWAQISFFYISPLPQGIVTDNMSIFQYNGTYKKFNKTYTGYLENGTSFTYNVELTNWTGGVWKELYTLISTSEKLIMGPNITHFSVFAPFGWQTEPEPEPVPEPTPTPKPSPQSGASPGEGGQPGGPTTEEIPIFPDMIRLNLTFPKNVTFMQGEAGQIPFSITNFGDITIYNITLFAEVPKGWESPIYEIESLAPGELLSDDFLMSVYEKAPVGDYYVPITVTVNMDGQIFRVIRDVLRVIVVPRGNLSRLKIVEYPPVIEMLPNDRMKISFLVENIGDVDLRNITIKNDPSDCLREIYGSSDVLSGEKKTVQYTFLSDKAGTCNYNLKFMADGKIVGFAPVTFVIKSKLTLYLRSYRFYILLLILAAWSVLTFKIIGDSGISEKKKPKKEEKGGLYE